MTNDESYAPVPEPVEGDVNGDSKVGIGDIVSVTNFMADGEASGVTLEQAQRLELMMKEEEKNFAKQGEEQ